MILRPDVPHKRNAEDSEARKAAEAFLNMRGNSPRIHRNTLVFLAADGRELENLEQATAQYLAWSSIIKDEVKLDLTVSQQSQAEPRKSDANSTINTRIGASFIWALVPYQEDPTGDVTWEQHKVASGGGGVAERTGIKVRNVERIYPSIGAVILRMKALNRLWKDRDHVTVAELADWMPKYLYLPRIKNSQVIENAILDAGGLFADDTFATAQAYDEEAGRYLGLRMSGAPSFIDNDTCLINPDVAKQQQEEEEPPTPPDGPGPDGPGPDGPGPDGPGPDLSPTGPVRPTLFVGSVKLDADRLGRGAGKIHEEILANLTDLPGVRAEVTMEIQVRVPEGVSEDIVRVVSENASVLKFTHAGFEKG